MSVTFSLKILPVLKARNATSDIVLLSPAMCRGVKLDACCLWIRIPSMRNRRPAIIDDEVRRLRIQETAAVLSQNIAKWR